MKLLIFIVLICVLLWFARKFTSKYKVAKVGSMALVTGGVKCGKSTLSVYLALREYKSRLRRTKFSNFFRKMFRKELIEEPLLYSNVPLKCKYSPLTDKLLTREERFVYNSVIYCQEASLVADSQLIKNIGLNNALLLFNKLIGHSTKGGVIIYDTQSISDVHYSIKRCLSNYFYIHHVIKWIPFFIVGEVKECRYSEDGSVSATDVEDIESTTKRVIIPKRVWRYFDCYCYSILTDSLPVANTVIDGRELDNLKAEEIISFRPDFKKVKKEDKENE